MTDNGYRTATSKPAFVLRCRACQTPVSTFKLWQMQWLICLICYKQRRGQRPAWQVVAETVERMVAHG